MRVYIDIHTCILHTLIYMCTYIHIHMYNERLRGALDGDMSESHSRSRHLQCARTHFLSDAARRGRCGRGSGAAASAGVFGGLLYVTSTVGGAGSGAGSLRLRLYPRFFRPPPLSLEAPPFLRGAASSSSSSSSSSAPPPSAFASFFASCPREVYMYILYTLIYMCIYIYNPYTRYTHRIRVSS